MVLLVTLFSLIVGMKEYELPVVLVVFKSKELPVIMVLCARYFVDRFKPCCSHLSIHFDLFIDHLPTIFAGGCGDQVTGSAQTCILNIATESIDLSILPIIHTLVGYTIGIIH